MSGRILPEPYVLPPVFRPGSARRRPDAAAAANARTPLSPAAPATGMRLWVLSDLAVHEAAFRLPDPLPAFDALLVAGGVAEGLAASVDWLAGALGGRHAGKPVVLVPGISEYRTALPMRETLRLGRERAGELGITVLADEAVRLDDGQGGTVHVAGATLWTDWALGGPGYAGCARARARTTWRGGDGILADAGGPWGPYDGAAAHARSRAYVEDFLTSVVVQAHGLPVGPASLAAGVRPGDRAVVLTHHAPSARSLDPRWPDWPCGGWEATTFASDLEDVLRAWGAPALWVHGRVPGPVDYRLGKTRVLANPRRVLPRGQAVDAAPFDPGLVVRV